MTALEQKAAIPEAQRLGAQVMAADEREERDQLYWDRLVHALMHHKYVWRSLERLALAAGTSPQEAERVLRQHPDEVVISRGRSGRTIARHASRQPV